MSSPSGVSGSRQMTELAKTLTVWRGTAVMLNIVLGAGLLSLPGVSVGVTGDWALVVWAACALAAMPLLLVFGLIGRRLPASDGLSAVAKAAFGRFGYIVATLLFLGAVVLGLPAIALTGGHYLAIWLGGSAYFYAAMLLLAGLSLNMLSPRIAGAINAAIASVLVLVFIAVAIAALSITRPSLETLAVMPVTPFDPSLFAAGFVMVFFAFTGWEVGSTLSGEFRNPRRDYPLAVGLSFLVAVILYAMLVGAVFGAELDGHYEAAFAYLFDTAFGVAGAGIVAAVATVMITANLGGAVWAVSRMVYASASGGLLPRALGRLSAGGTPVRAVIVTVAMLLLVLLASFAGFIDLATMLGLAGQNFLLLYGVAAAALIKSTTAARERWLGWFCIALIGTVAVAHGVQGMAWPVFLLLVSLAIYLRGRHLRARLVGA